MKILIISPTFSMDNVVGAIRLRGLAKYLSEFGWESTVLSTKASENLKLSYNIIETDFEHVTTYWKNKIRIGSSKSNNNPISDNGVMSKNNKSTLKYLSKYIDEFFFYPDYARYWYKPAVEAGSKLLKKENFDAILSSSSPVTSHLVANELKIRFKIPWIADLRDLWTQNPYHDSTTIRKFFEQRLEIKVLSNADFITTTTPNSADDLKKLHKRKNIYPILNGFDIDNNIEDVSLPNKISLTYAGNLYGGKRDPKIFFEALKELDIENKIKLSEFSIDFYGPSQSWLIKEIEEYGLEDIVNVHGMIPREEVHKIQKNTQILLLLSWNNPNEQGIIPSKIYEYFAASRPILSIGPPEGLVKDLIESTNTGIHLSNYEDIKKAIKNIYDEFILTGKIKYNGIPNEIEKYNQKGMSKKFAVILNRVTE